MQLRLIWLCCLIIAGAAATLWFLNQRTSHIEITTQKYINTPSVSFNDIEMIINSTDGKPQYKLYAPKYWLYDDEKRSEFESPDIEIFRKNGSKVYANSLKGNTHDNNNIITLIGDVKIKQPKSEHDPYSLEVFTDKLTIFPKEQRATTDSFVTAKGGNQMVSATGMTLDIETRIVHMHSDVKGYYEP